MAVEKKHKILIIEDDAFQARAYQIGFNNQNLEVTLLTDGQSAMAYLDGNPADVVILDLILPDMSGFDILQAIRGNKKWGNVPVIILSNLGQKQDVDNGKALGANEYLIKTNIKISEVVEVVKSYIKS